MIWFRDWQTHPESAERNRERQRRRDRQRCVTDLVKNNVALDLKRAAAEVWLVGAETANLVKNNVAFSEVLVFQRVASTVPTGNGEVFEMMEITHVPNSVSMCILPTVISVFRSAFRSRAAVELENFALRHQLNVLKRSVKHRPRLTSADRLLWVVLSRLWADWRSALTIVQPETVIAWHRKAFRLFGSW